MTESRRVYQGLVVDVYRDAVDLPNGQHAELEVVRHPGGAALVAVNAKNEVCLLRQYRHVTGSWIWEIPAGKLEPNEPPRTTALRELEEEAGVRAARCDDLGAIWPSPGVYAERLYLYLGRELTPVELQHEHGELIEVHWFPFARALEMVRSGEIDDAKTIAGIVRAQPFIE
jgi:ADP-ribose pyrophosphatase